MSKKFMYCKHCGNLVGVIHDGGVPMICCGEPMSELIPNKVDASVEKHLPMVQNEDGKYSVQVGSVLHPMTEEHHIDWIYLESDEGGQRKLCKNSPTAVFYSISKITAVYAYCNLHGLWKADLK